MNSVTDRGWLVCGAINGFIAVAAGAFAAHGLKDRLSPEMLAIFETGARYQMYHALALLGLAALRHMISSRARRVAGWSFLLGIILFSGSLYALSLSGIEAFGMATPIGGVAFLIGWMSLVVGRGPRLWTHDLRTIPGHPRSS